MNILIDRLPDTIKVQGQEYRIQTDFRAFIKLEALLFDNIDPVDKLIKILDLMIVDLTPELVENLKLPEFVKEMISQIIQFYSMNEEPEENSSIQKRVYSFDSDAAYIYGDFYSQYGIDLSTAHLHWWVFRTLLLQLNKNSKFAEVIGFRSVVLDSKMSKEQRAYYARMKKIYQLPDAKKSVKSGFAHSFAASIGLTEAGEVMRNE